MKSLRRCLPNGLEAAWLLLGFATLSIEQRGAAEALSGSIDSTILVRFGMDCVALTIVMVHLRRVPRFRLNPITLFLAYVMFGVASSLWSASFVASLGKSVELMAATLVVWITMAGADKEARLQRLVYWTMVEAGLWLAYAVIGGIFDPQDFSEPSPGIFPYALASPRVSSNSISQLGAFLSLFCLAKALAGARRCIFGLCYLVCLAFPIAAQGRTGMVSVVVGSALLFARHFPLESFVVIPATTGLASFLAGDTLLKLFLRGQDNELLYSLSGRTGWWEAGWQGFLTKPFSGAGFGIGGRTVFLNLFGYQTDSVSSVHNGFLEVLLGVGLLGFALWACAVLWTARLAVTAYLRGDRLPTLIGMVVAVTSTFLSIGVGGWLDVVPQYFLATSAFLWVRSRHRVEALERYPSRLTITAAPMR